MVSKKTGRPVGRPRKERPPPLSAEQKRAQRFLKDPDRFPAVLLEALNALEMGRSQRARALAIAAQLVGVEGESPRLSAEHPGFVVTNWEQYATRKGVIAATLEGRAHTLQKKQRRYRSAAEQTWRKNMARALMLSLTARDPRVMADVYACVCASGELDRARAILALWRIIAARISDQKRTQTARELTS